MKIKKIAKAGICLLSAAMLLASSVTAYAQKYKGTTFNFKYAQRNNTYDVCLTTDKQEGVAGLDYTIVYDTSKWKLVKNSYKCAIESSDTATAEGSIHTIWETAEGEALPKTIATASFKKIADDADIYQILLSVNEYYDDSVPPEDLLFQVDYAETDKVNRLKGNFNWEVFIVILCVAALGGAGYWFIGVKGYFRPFNPKH